MALIRKDSIGLYAFIGGWVCRPEYDIEDLRIRMGNNKPSKFKEGDKVRGSHPPGTSVYLRVGKRGTPEYYMEVWSITGLMSFEYQAPRRSE